MKKTGLIVLFTILLCGFVQAKVIKLGLINPTPRNLENILFLKRNGLITIDSLEIVGICHETQAGLMGMPHSYFDNESRVPISILTIKNSLSVDSLFCKNKCTGEFEELFNRTDGLLFLGGADILPSIYGEETFLTTELIQKERNWEISFLFHLLGGSQNEDFKPFLEQRPDYLILGICLGMQELNVACGGTLCQDIPFEIYKRKTYESVLEQNPDNQHKNYRNRVDYSDNESTFLHFHPIRITNNSVLDFEQIKHPLVATAHHQSVDRVGKDLKIIATSLDKKVIEAISHSRYRNVYGIQFHTDFSILYKQQDFYDSKNRLIKLAENDRLFHVLFWGYFSSRLKK
ncbi:MAG TPA: gamma-glutamyl-gamma-aminobutyrate hydrolase family protein [Prolixibacteraceae bacterium]|nr:gamma-glutamyl-gamma-aminobutyrate hydrolase family protein [Prolixibacteraceae bacterium]